MKVKFSIKIRNKTYVFYGQPLKLLHAIYEEFEKNLWQIEYKSLPQYNNVNVSMDKFTCNFSMCCFDEFNSPFKMFSCDSLSSFSFFNFKFSSIDSLNKLRLSFLNTGKIQLLTLNLHLVVRSFVAVHRRLRL